MVEARSVGKRSVSSVGFILAGNCFHLALSFIDGLELTLRKDNSDTEGRGGE